MKTIFTIFVMLFAVAVVACVIENKWDIATFMLVAMYYARWESTQ